MNRVTSTSTRLDQTSRPAAQFQPVTAEELAFVSGGGIISWIKRAAKWVKDHIYVDTKNQAGGIKGTF